MAVRNGFGVFKYKGFKKGIKAKSFFLDGLRDIQDKENPD
jgi:hypothetical protein